MPDKAVLRQALVALSLANLMFLKLWLKLLPYRDGSGYVLAASPFNSYLAALLNVLLWGGVFFLLLGWGRGRERLYPWLVLALNALVYFTALYGLGNTLTSLASFAFRFGPESVPLLETALGIGGAVLLALLVRYRVPMVRLWLTLPLLFAPFLPVTLGQAACALARCEPASRFRPHRVAAAAPLENRWKNSVVWIIFDETDYRLCFAKRPRDLALPAFDRFQSAAFWASRAYSPSDATQVSLPALLTGVPLKVTRPQGAGRLDLVRSDTGATLDFASQSTVFDRVKKRLGSTALFGWYHPYSRVLHDLDLCADYPMYTVFSSDSFLEVLLFQNREIWDFRFLPCGDTVIGRNNIRIVRQMQNDVLGTVRTQHPSLLFLHYPLPHAPNIYDRRTGKLGFNRDRRRGYFDNMALADRMLGELRGEMERRGTWDDALVIISSDHHWRTNTYDGVTDYEHVPFLMKLPHQAREYPYAGRFNTVLTQGLLLEVVDGRVGSPEAAAAWLDRAMRRGDIPVAAPSRQVDDD